MAEFNRKKSHKRLLYSPLTLIILCVVLLVMLKALWGVYTKEQRSAEFLAREQSELGRISERQKELTQAVDYLKTERGVEAEIRSKFRVVKEGESVAVIIGDEESTKTGTTTATTTPGFWRKIWNWF